MKTLHWLFCVQKSHLVLLCVQRHWEEISKQLQNTKESILLWTSTCWGAMVHTKLLRKKRFCYRGNGKYLFCTSASRLFGNPLVQLSTEEELIPKPIEVCCLEHFQKFLPVQKISTGRIATTYVKRCKGTILCRDSLLLVFEREGVFSNFLHFLNYLSSLPSVTVERWWIVVAQWVAF